MIADYIDDAMDDIEGAIDKIDLFCKKAKPRNEDAESTLNAIGNFRDRLKKLYSAYRFAFDEVINGYLD